MGYVIDQHSAVFDTYLKLLDSKGKLLVKDGGGLGPQGQSRVLVIPVSHVAP
jgi:hypothetical protein